MIRKTDRGLQRWWWGLTLEQREGVIASFASGGVVAFLTYIVMYGWPE